MNHIVVVADGEAISGSDLVNLLRRGGQINALLREWMLEHVLRDVELEPGTEDQLIAELRQNQGLTSDEAFANFLHDRQLTESLLRQSLSRPHKVVLYREERWGPRANSLYLQHKDNYDQISYRKLHSGDADVMQEVYFRLKDGEETWESLARQFQPSNPSANALQGPIAVSAVEPELLQELRRAGPGKLLKPLRLGQEIVVAQLEEVHPAEFNEELRTLLLRDAFDAWIAEECSRMLTRLEFPQ